MIQKIIDEFKKMDRSSRNIFIFLATALVVSFSVAVSIGITQNI